jgi:hypothetical protein
MKDNELGYIKYMQNILILGERKKKGTARRRENQRGKNTRKEGRYVRVCRLCIWISYKNVWDTFCAIFSL